jgi:hypothetical protein
MSDVVYALRNGTAYDGKVPRRFVKGQPFWKSDRVVQLKPEMFSAEPPTPEHPNPAVVKVEKATAAPGEKRGVRR